MTEKPNILFFFTDDQRFDTIHALGNKEMLRMREASLLEIPSSLAACGIIGMFLYVIMIQQVNIRIKLISPRTSRIAIIR